MKETIAVTGMVLSAIPIGEYDKRIVLLTKEQGKVYAFARGAKRAKSPLMAGSSPFAFGTFHLYENRNSNSLEHVEIKNYFRELTENFEAAYYGMYFCELADYYTVEYLEAVSILKLLYKTLQELTKERIPKELIRYIFELKLLQFNGEAPDAQMFQEECGHPSTIYTIQFIYATPVEKLYSFLVKEEVLQDLRRISRKYFLPKLDKPMKSLAILEDCLKLSGFYT